MSNYRTLKVERRPNRSAFGLPNGSSLDGATAQDIPNIDLPTLAVRHITAPRPEREVVRSGEIALIRAVLDDAVQQCRIRAEECRSGSGMPSRVVAARWVQGRELWLWIESRSMRPFTLGWICEALTAADGRAWRREAVSAAMLEILTGRREIPRTNRAPVGSQWHEITKGRVGHGDPDPKRAARAKREGRG